MARRPRIQIAQAYYHITSRGNHGQPIARDDTDRRVFIRSLEEACAKTRWYVHAFCLLADHFHLVIETPQPNLVVGMKWLLGTYARRFNAHHKTQGHLFSGRYKAQLIEPTRSKLERVCDYVHLNPYRAGIHPPDVALQKYPWSSLPLLLNPKHEELCPWLRKTHVDLERHDYSRCMDDIFADVRSSWCIGSEDYMRTVAARVAAQAVGHFGPEIHASAEVTAENIIKKELQLRGLTELSMGQRRKSDTEKIQIARRLRDETTMTLDWIAKRLGMGTRTYLNHLLYWDRRDGRTPPSRQGKHATEMAREPQTDAAVLLTDPMLDRSAFD